MTHKALCVGPLNTLQLSSNYILLLTGPQPHGPYAMSLSAFGHSHVQFPLPETRLSCLI